MEGKAKTMRDTLFLAYRNVQWAAPLENEDRAMKPRGNARRRPALSAALAKEVLGLWLSKS